MCDLIKERRTVSRGALVYYKLYTTHTLIRSSVLHKYVREPRSPRLEGLRVGVKCESDHRT